jgi:hypothetical protein
MPAYYYFFYDWKVQQNPCASPSVLVAGIDSCNTNISSVSSPENSLNIFPNPNNGLFNISFNAYQKDNYVIELINTLGQTVYSESLSNFNGAYLKSINIESYGKGIYLLNIKGSQNNLLKKILTY